MRNLPIVLLLLAALAAAAGAWATRTDRLMLGHSARVSAGDLTDLPLLMPKQGPEGLVVLVSGSRGIGPRERELTVRLLAGNMIVLPVDLAAWRKRLDARAGECLYLGSELEDIAKETLRTVELDTYFHPVVAGVGEGGTLAWAALADAPVATFAGAVSLDPAPTLDTRLPTCPGTAPIARQGKGFAYGFDAPVPGPATLISASPLPTPSSPTVGEVRRDQAADAASPNAIVEADAARRLDAAVAAILHIADADARSQDLPVVDIPANGDARAVAVFYSGDGGWRDLDKSMGDWLAQNGVHVVGVDSLRYFWSERSPDEIAADAQAIVAKADPSGRLPVMVLGYSFGADTFPFAWTALTDALRDRIRLVGLLGTERTTRFQVSVGGWLGMGGDRQVAPAIATIPADRVLCVHGEDEDETACSDPALAGIEIVKTAGGHHFDGDYDALARRVLDAFDARLRGSTTG